MGLVTHNAVVANIDQAPAVLDALVALRDHAAIEDVAPLHDGEWGRATLEACLAMLRSSREGREVRLKLQVAARRGRA